MHTLPLLLALPVVTVAAGYTGHGFPSFKHNSPFINRLKARQAPPAVPPMPEAPVDKYVPGYIDQFLAALGPQRVTMFLPATCAEGDTDCKKDLCKQRFVISERIVFDPEALPVFLCEFWNPVTEECPDPWKLVTEGMRCPGNAEEVLLTVMANTEWSKEEATAKLEGLVPGMFAVPEPEPVSTKKKNSSSTKKKQASKSTKSTKDTKSSSSKTTSTGSFASTTVVMVTEFAKRSAQEEEPVPTEPASRSESKESKPKQSEPSKTTSSGSSKTTGKPSTEESEEGDEEIDAALDEAMEEIEEGAGQLADSLLFADPSGANLAANPMAMPLPEGETRPFNIPYDIPIRPMPPGPVQQVPSFMCYEYTIAEKTETCYWLTARTFTKIDSFLRLNPQVNGVFCDKLWADYAYCIKELGDILPVALAPEFGPTPEDLAMMEEQEKAMQEAEEKAKNAKKPASG